MMHAGNSNYLGTNNLSFAANIIGKHKMPYVKIIVNRFSHSHYRPTEGNKM